MKDKNWIMKEKRELFCKTTNTMLMRLPEGQGPEVNNIHKVAQSTVDKAFSTYPHLEEEKQVTPDIPVQ